jgi:peroxiredoxin
MPPPAPGDAFPRLTLESAAGPLELSGKWSRGPLVIAFMRHFGCAFCRQHLIDLKQAYAEIQQAGGDIVAIFQYGAEATGRFCEAREIPYECVGDPLREGYAKVELGRGGFREYLGWRVFKGWARAARGGVYVGRPQGDVAQRPGTFVVDSSGRIVLAHYNQHSTDNVAVDRVVAAVRQADAATPTAA